MAELSRLTMICVDDTPNSDRCFDSFFRNICQPGDTIGLIHLYTLPTMDDLFKDDNFATDEDLKIQIDGIMNNCKKIKDKYRVRCQDNKVTPMFFFQNVASGFGPRICDIVEKNNASIVVLSRDGPQVSGSKRGPALQVAKHVSNHSACPVFLTPPDTATPRSTEREQPSQPLMNRHPQHPDHNGGMQGPPAGIQGPPYTLYVYLGGPCQDIDLFAMFAQFGRIKEVNTVSDKGYGFVKFFDYYEAAQAAEALNGTMHTEAQKRVQVSFKQTDKGDKSDTGSSDGGKQQGPPFTLYVYMDGHCHQGELYSMFAQYGRLKEVDAVTDKGFGIVKFFNYHEALEAVNCLNGTLRHHTDRKMQVRFKKDKKSEAKSDE